MCAECAYVCVGCTWVCVCAGYACVCWMWKDVCCRQRGCSFPGEAEIRGWSQTPEKVRAQKKLFKRHRGRVKCQWRGRSLWAQRQVGRGQVAHWVCFCTEEKEHKAWLLSARTFVSRVTASHSHCIPGGAGGGGARTWGGWVPRPAENIKGRTWRYQEVV